MSKRQRWKKLQPIEGTHGGCLNCGPRPEVFRRRMRIGVGFGWAALTKDSEVVWSEPPNADWKDCMTGERAERIAKKDPNHDWRIVLDGPLSGRTYQRQGGAWVLVEQNEGFA